MATIYDVSAAELIDEVANDLKKREKFPQPEWVKFVKTGVHKERRPENPNWWWIRAASILRKIYMNGPIGVSRLRTVYGGRKNKGVKPEKSMKGSGKIVRSILQEFDNLNFTKKTLRTPMSSAKGRVITPEGQSYMDKIATDILISKENK
ncbi:MAG: 30S ribosomal protein S19e [Candidatus Altiarchaeales archaeon HGW-Altiarchaeales-3]|nr:MAG: 30S ribosomal protein S19e [Candidatus Altiarchaeales archaeon HGW-Altiarchaeales-3]